MLEGPFSIASLIPPKIEEALTAVSASNGAGAGLMRPLDNALALYCSAPITLILYS